MTKYNLKTAALATVALVLVLCAFSYMLNPGFGWGSINPVDGLDGTAFALSFGLGFPVWLSFGTIAVVLMAVWFGLLCLVRKIIK